MKIEVLHNYGGRNTNERRIPPGVYEADDERLFGLADYLVENGHAVVITEPEVEMPDELILVNPPAVPAPPKTSRLISKRR